MPVYIGRLADTTVLVIFALVYLATFLGELPGLAVDRTGVALLGAIALEATGRVTVSDAWSLLMSRHWRFCSASCRLSAGRLWLRA